jgi:hypothetical protein
VVEDLFGEGADEGLPPEWAMVVLLGALENVGDMEGAFGGQEYVIYNIHVRLTLGPGRSGGALFSPTERAQGAKLSQGACFKDFDEVVFSKRLHIWCKEVACGAIYGRSRYMSIV